MNEPVETFEAPATQLDFQSSFEVAPAGDTLPVDAQVQTESVPPPSGTGAADTAPPAKEEPSQSELFLRLAKLDREKAEAEREVRQLRAAQQTVAKTEAPKDIKKWLAEDPIAALKSVGINPDFVVKRVLSDQLGDSAPAGLKSQAAELSEKQRLEHRLAELESQLSKATAPPDPVMAEMRAYEDSVKASLADLSGFATVGKLAATDKNYVYQQVMAEVDRDANEKMSRGDYEAGPLSPKEALERLENRWAAVFGNSGKAQQPPQTQQSTKAAPTLAAIQAGAVSPDGEPTPELPEWGEPGRDEAIRLLAQKLVNQRR